MKWCPVLLPAEEHSDHSFSMQPHKLHPGMQVLLAIKVHKIEAMLSIGNEAHICVLLRCATDAVVWFVRVCVCVCVCVCACVVAVDERAHSCTASRAPHRSDGTSARTGPAYTLPTQEKELTLDTVLYMPVEFHPATCLVIHLVVNKTGANAPDTTITLESRTSSTASRGSPRRSAANDTVQKKSPTSSNAARSGSRPQQRLSMEACANGSTKIPRTFALRELVDLTGLWHCCSNGTVQQLASIPSTPIESWLKLVKIIYIQLMFQLYKSHLAADMLLSGQLASLAVATAACAHIVCVSALLLTRDA